MKIDPALGSVLAILAMATATYLSRSLGFLAMSQIPQHPRVRRFLEALPGAIIIAIVLPIAVRAGVVGLAAIGAALVASLLTRNEFAAVMAGMGVAALMRLAGL